jgi:hypothetical protein
VWAGPIVHKRPYGLKATDQHAVIDSKHVRHVPQPAKSSAPHRASRGTLRWTAVEDGEQPYAIARTDGAFLAFASLWVRMAPPGRRDVAHLHDYDDEREHGHATPP